MLPRRNGAKPTYSSFGRQSQARIKSLGGALRAHAPDFEQRLCPATTAPESRTTATSRLKGTLKRIQIILKQYSSDNSTVEA